MTRIVAPLTKDLAGLAGLFLTSGVTHLVKPEVFEPLVPRAMPRRRELIYASGVAELACAAGLLHPATRRYAGWASAALLVAILPGNVQMSATFGKRAQRRGTLGARAAFAGTVARLPLQLPLIRTALKATGR
ncbi:MauE/DoxX family redox-associated membrane protein [Nostocoides sp. HKS02]|uniref:DoxX family protein n=1 Tax=Nostocoides sp. HKS02 TaxID=1813880 RepID=UPI0012B49DE0|nr:MauE/DoxX family redox-associated membrane protein [Tetrasphaera sp. HKS02]QGN57784.1 DoxX family protein [Tetrasphaera sp. HKS02]